MKDLEFMYDNKDGVKTAKSYETFADFVNAVETNETDCPALDCKNVQATIFGSNLITPRFNTVGDLYQFGKSVVASKEREREELLPENVKFCIPKTYCRIQ